MVDQINFVYQCAVYYDGNGFNFVFRSDHMYADNELLWWYAVACSEWAAAFILSMTSNQNF